MGSNVIYVGDSMAEDTSKTIRTEVLAHQIVLLTGA